MEEYANDVWTRGRRGAQRSLRLPRTSVRTACRARRDAVAITQAPIMVVCACEPMSPHPEPLMLRDELSDHDPAARTTSRHSECPCRGLLLLLKPPPRDTATPAAR